jgi:hypothetical protein
LLALLTAAALLPAFQTAPARRVVSFSAPLAEAMYAIGAL